MHFHLPKPMHGWRAFVGEVGIIVIGVLIALAAEQGVEAVHDRHVAAETRASVKSEIESDLGSLKLRASVEPCIQRRLSELRSILDQWGRTGSFKTPLTIGGAPHIGMVAVRYQAAQSSGHFALLPSEEQYRMGGIEQTLIRTHEIESDEGLLWSRLQMLQSGADVLSPTDRTLVRDALQSAVHLDYEVRITISQTMPIAMTYGYQPNMDRVNAILPYASRNGHYSPSICLPLDTPPAEAKRLTGSRVTT